MNEIKIDPIALRDLRVARGLTQEALAVKFGTTRQAISQYEAGQTAPNGRRVIQYLLLFGVKPRDILRKSHRTLDNDTGSV